MKNLSITLKKAFLIVGLIIAAVLVHTPAGAGEDGLNFALRGKDLYSRGNLSNNHLESASGVTDLMIPLSGSLSLDLRLSSVGRGQSLPGETQPGTPPIPIPRSPGSDLRYSRLGLGVSFGF